jgi:hypothetical protein
MNQTPRFNITNICASVCTGLALATGTCMLHAQTLSTTVTADAVIYPSRGQDAKQQDMDRYQCHDWARGQSGFDPTRQGTASASAAPATATPHSADATGGMAKGAISGAAIGELSHHDAGRAAAVGALGGGLLNKMKEQQARQQQAGQQPAAQQQQARQQQKATYDRAFGACMEGRGYTVR